MRKCFKKYIRKIGNKKDNDVTINVAQLERNNNKCYTSAFIYIYIQIMWFLMMTETNLDKKKLLIKI